MPKKKGKYTLGGGKGGNLPIKKKKKRADVRKRRLTLFATARRNLKGINALASVASSGGEGGAEAYAGGYLLPGMIQGHFICRHSVQEE